jgi:hypothetical protein
MSKYESNGNNQLEEKSSTSRRRTDDDDDDDDDAGSRVNFYVCSQPFRDKHGHYMKSVLSLPMIFDFDGEE